MIEAFEFISKTLNPDKYCIIGSAALYLQGVCLNPNDIDVLIEMDELNRLLSADLFKSIRAQPNASFRSNEFAVLYIDNIKIELMSGFQYFWNGDWYECDIEDRNLVEFEGINLQVMDLASCILLLQKWGRPKDIEKLEKIKGRF